MGYSQWGCKESETVKYMSTDTHMQLPLPQIKCSPVVALVQAIRLPKLLSIPLDGKDL